MGIITDVVTVLHPAAEDVAEPQRLAPRLSSLQGMTVGLIDNHKRNANIYLEALGHLLQERYGVSQVVTDKRDQAKLNRRVSSGELRRVRTGLLVHSAFPPSWRQDLWLGVLGAGDGAAVDGEAADLCGEALDGASRCADLIRRLLAFARRQPLHPERTNVNALVANIIQLLGRTLGEDITGAATVNREVIHGLRDPRQPEGGLIGLGGSPVRGGRSRRASGFIDGVEANSACV